MWVYVSEYAYICMYDSDSDSDVCLSCIDDTTSTLPLHVFTSLISRFHFTHSLSPFHCHCDWVALPLSSAMDTLYLHTTVYCFDSFFTTNPHLYTRTNGAVITITVLHLIHVPVCDNVCTGCASSIRILIQPCMLSSPLYYYRLQCYCHHRVHQRRLFSYVAVKIMMIIFSVYVSVCDRCDRVTLLLHLRRHCVCMYVEIISVYV